MNNNLINFLKDLIVKTGKIALDIKKEGIRVDYKSDGSPVTNADKHISQVVYENLHMLTRDIPIICEERPLPTLSSSTFWLIDPIDGTKSYISDKSSYTINIGLIQNGIPIIGLIYQPETEKLYYTDKDGKLKIEQNLIEVSVPNSVHSPKAEFNAVVGCYNVNQNTKNFLNKHLINHVQAISSSIKLCLIAEGTADIYPKFDQTMEWDIAAGHALIKAGGGNIFNSDGSETSYGKANFVNSAFFACSRHWLNKS